MCIVSAACGMYTSSFRKRWDGECVFHGPFAEGRGMSGRGSTLSVGSARFGTAWADRIFPAHRRLTARETCTVWHRVGWQVRRAYRDALDGDVAWVQVPYGLLPSGHRADCLSTRLWTTGTNPTWSSSTCWCKFIASLLLISGRGCCSRFRLAFCPCERRSHRWLKIRLPSVFFRLRWLLAVMSTYNSCRNMLAVCIFMFKYKLSIYFGTECSKHNDRLYQYFISIFQYKVSLYSGIRLGNTRERGIQPKITCSTCARSLPVIPRLYISYVHSWTIRSPAKWPKNSKNTTFNVLSRSPKSGSTNTIITIRKHTVYRHFLKYKDPIRDE